MDFLTAVRVKLYQMSHPELEYVNRKKDPHWRIKPYTRKHPTKYQAQARLKLARISYGLYGRVKGFVNYKGWVTPVVAAEVGKAMQGSVSEPHLTVKEIDRMARLQRARLLYRQESVEQVRRLREAVEALRRTVT